MICCGLPLRAVRPPFLVLFLVLWAIRLAGRVQSSVERPAAAHTHGVQAALSEKVLPHRPVLAALHSRLPIQDLLAPFDVREQRLGGSQRHDLQVPEPTPLTVFAVLEVDARHTAPRLALGGKEGPQAARQEHRIAIYLDHPAGALVVSRRPDRLPDLCVQSCVDPGAGLLALENVEVPIGVVHRHEGHARGQVAWLVAENAPLLAREDAYLPVVRRLQQVQLVRALGFAVAASVCHVNGKAVHRCSGCNGIVQVHRLASLGHRHRAGRRLAGRAVLHALGRARRGRHEAGEASHVAARCIEAVPGHVAALLPRRLCQHLQQLAPGRGAAPWRAGAATCREAARGAGGTGQRRAAEDPAGAPARGRRGRVAVAAELHVFAAAVRRHPGETVIRDEV
mmetsp:Transcript_13966/g.37564  ORF Transcript_13966/g.37564 Transcript_13966/m.37564 type:complete len:396 (+) Transcript_13966:392-1579(+)